MKILEKFELIKNVLIAILVVVGLVILTCVLGIHFIGEYVQENYIVVSSRSPVQSKQAFLWEYTVKTGDMTLATATGNEDAFADRLTNQDLSEISWSDTDYRDVVRAIATTWLQQGTGVSSEAKRMYDVIKEELNGNYNTYISSTEWEDKWGDKTKYPNLYDTGTYNDFSYTYSGSTFKVNSARCCCCLSETFCEYMTKFDNTGKDYEDVMHTTSVGATASDYQSLTQWVNSERETKKYYSQNETTANGLARYVAPSLDSITGIDADVTINDLIESGKMKPGCIITFGTTRAQPSDDNTVPGSPTHVELVVYIDDNYIYTAGAGNSRAIMQNAIIGCNSRWSRDTAVITMQFGGTNGPMPIINLIHWMDSVHIK